MAQEASAMASFCTHCASPVAESERFCSKCGAATGNAGPAAPTASATSAPVNAAATPTGAAAAAPPPTAYYRVSPPPKKDNRVLAVIWIIAGFFVVMGIAGVVGIVFVSRHFQHRVKEIQEQSRPTAAEWASSARARRVTNVCDLLPDADVARTIQIPIVRSLSRGAQTCTYYADGMASDFMKKKLAQQRQFNSTPAQQREMESIISRFGRSMGSDQTISPNGQTPVFMVTLLAQDGKFQMGLMKPIFKGMGPLGKMNEISGLGDEAFSASDSLLLVRKGDAAIMFTYNYLTDGTPKAEALARQILTQL